MCGSAAVRLSERGVPARRAVQSRHRDFARPPLTSHPYLLAPHRAAAFADLLAQPVGTDRSWSARWGWTHQRVRRFLLHLQRLGLIHISSTRDGTSVSFCDTAARAESVAKPWQDRGKTVAPPGQLPINPRELPRETTLGSNVDNSTDDGAADLAARCIAAMNEVGAFRFAGAYLPVRRDQRRSVTAARAWLAAGLDPDWCVVEVRRQTMVVKRTPVTLGFCQRGVLEAWTGRHQTEMRLLHSIKAAETAPETALAAPQPRERAAALVSDPDGPPVDWRALLAERGVLVPGREKAGPQKISELGLALTG